MQIDAQVTSNAVTPASVPRLPTDAPVAANAVDSAAVAAPSVANTVSGATVSAPVVIGPNTGTQVEPPFALNHARILYDNLLLNYSSVSVASGTNGSYALVRNTYKKWTITATGSNIIITLPAAVDIDTICIGAHNMSDGGYGCGASWSPDDSTDFTDFTSGETPSDNKAIMFHRTTTVSAKRIKITLSSGSGGMGIGYISAGVALQMQRPFFSGHTPISMGDKTVYRNNMTSAGEFSSRSIIRKGFENNISYQGLDRGWIENYFLDFKELAKESMYFIAWNLLDYPSEVGLCMTSGDISMSFSGTRDLMSVTWSQVGHGSV